MTLLVSLAAPARTGIVAADDRAARERRIGAGEQAFCLAVAGRRGETAPGQRGGRRPLAKRDAIAQQLAKLQRTRDRIGKVRRQRRQFILRHDAAEIVEPVKPERHAGRIGGLECETIRERFVRIANAVVALEQRAAGAADRDVFRFRRARLADPAALRAVCASAAKSRRCRRACRRRTRTTSRRCNRSRGRPRRTPPD